VVGSVVGLREKIGWFEKKPLLGKKILITRARRQAGHLVQLLRYHGAEPISFPTIEIRPPENWDGVDRAIDNISEYDWIIFTSTNGVNFFMGRLRDRNMDIRDLKGIRIGSIGSSTAQCVEAMGIKVDLLPEEYRAEGILEELAKEEVRGVRFLLPRAEKARDILPEELGKRGADVDVVAAYRTVIPDAGGEEIISLIEDGQIDLITFTSSSTVTHFAEIIGIDILAELLKGVTVASIGPITAEKAKELGIETHIMPDEYTIEGMVWEIVRYYRE
jgi:uroporphyrinogen III methyltransferase/synthase